MLPSATANPSGGQVVAGGADISQAGSTLTVTQHSDRAIISWQDFSIGAGELTTFVQPSATSAVLNRVTGGDLSAIRGTLSANGQVWLLNPNGVLVGSTGVIDTAGFLASTAAVADGAFMAGGDMTFVSAEGGAEIVNFGRVTALAGDVIFIARQVRNAAGGELKAPAGSVALAATGGEVLLKSSGTERLFIKPTSAVGALDNAGRIEAATAELRAAGGNEYALAINNTGVVRATGVVNEGGRILLRATGGTVRNSGTLSADAAASSGVSAATPEVHVLGRRVELADSSRIEAAGGFVDTSGEAVSIADGARVDTRTADRRFGTWLIDPMDFYVTAGGGAQTNSGIGADTLAANLQANHVTLATMAAGGEAGNIHVNADVSWSADTTLTLTAHNDIFINARITATGDEAGLALNHGAGRGYYLGSGGRVTLSGANSGFSVNGDAYTVIRDIDQLQQMANALGGRYVLGVDIAAGATADWNGGLGFSPIGDPGLPSFGIPETPFTGTFDGLGHVISGLTINRPTQSYVGLFGYVGASGRIRNVGLQDNRISGRGWTGVLAGLNKGELTQTYVAGVVLADSTYSGGLVGMNHGTVADSYASVDVEGRLETGGLVGRNSGIIIRSHATGDVNGTSNVGGLVGVSDSASSIGYSYATGSAEGDSGVGGLVGSNHGGVTQSYATGSATGGHYIGGLAGLNYGSGVITRSYATGEVTGDTATGGLVGLNNGAIGQSHWDAASTGQADAVGDQNGTTAQVSAIPEGGRYNHASYGQLGVWENLYGDVWVAKDGVNNPAWVMIEGSTRPFLYSEWSTTIRNTHQLQLMALDLGADYTLAFDIDASETAGANVSGMWSTAGFSPVGRDRDDYSGVFDGRGHVISGLVINRPTQSHAGLFGSVNRGRIHNVGMVGGRVSGNGYSGGLVGVLRDSHITLSYATSDVSGGHAVGGLVGLTVNGSITQSYATGDVTGDSSVGGLVGNSGSTFIVESHATGSVSGRDDIGGVVGHNASSIFTDSYYLLVGDRTIEASGRDANLAGGVRQDTGVVGKTLTVTASRNVELPDDIELADNHLLVQAGADLDVGVAINASTLTLESGGDITLEAGASLTAGGAGDALVLVAADAFINEAGASAVEATHADGRWLIYSDNPDDNTFGGLVSGSNAVWNTAYGDAVPATGNRYVFTGQFGELTVLGSFDDTKIYGEDYTAPTLVAGTHYTLTGFVNAADYGNVFEQDSAANIGLTGAPTVSSAGDDATANVGDYDFTWDDGDLANTAGYTFTAPTDGGTLTVDRRAITVTADAGQHKTYGDTDPLAFTYTVGGLGLANGDTLTGALNRDAGENAGAYAINQGDVTDAANANYAITYTGADFTIDRRAITVTADAGQHKTYGDTDPLAFTYTVGGLGLVNGDTLTGSLTREAGENAGAYAINQGGVTDAANANYAITYTGADFTIDPRAITVTAGSGTSIYGDAATNPSITLTGGTLAFTDTLDSIGVGNDFAITGTTNAGGHVIAVTGGNANYTITPVNGLWTVTPRALTVTAGDLTKTYGTEHVFDGTEFTADGLINGDEVVSATLTSAGAAVLANLAGSPYEIIVADAIGSGLSNYTITYVSGALTIEPDPVASGHVFDRFQIGTVIDDTLPTVADSHDGTFVYSGKTVAAGAWLHVSEGDVE